eukprot:CAMPEP_0194176340 /NCGR_PEP_ID=MMETSP0154-20130528/10259_1 /TAXON_ID=1049557 /ORGANISM="Thalassiothrix antarctica, Strain L6-D1" /LENGTH=190 /DNA_ID=CAMNT_0038890471 /DNA_START=148 /DNA_END=721 /DNA_ORIENTATION=+
MFSENKDELFDYNAILTSSLAEFFGTTLAILTIDRIGRIPLQATSYSLTGICILTLLLVANNSNASSDYDDNTSSDYDDNNNHRLVLITLAFLSRLCIMTANITTWVGTAEILTTEIRSSGHSAANAVARLGGFAAPYLLLLQNRSSIGLILFGIAILTTLTVLHLPETNGIALGSSGNTTTTADGITAK